jgi:pimeloyl-ACP methyl ester carboxylesterase
MADDIAALVRHLGLEKVDLMGYSLCGGVALHTAAGYPEFSEEVRALRVPTLFACADADMLPPSHAVEVFGLLDGGKRDRGWVEEGRPAGGHALAIPPGLTHDSIFGSPLLAAAAISYLDQ